MEGAMNRSKLESDRGADSRIDAILPVTTLDGFLPAGVNGIDVRELRRGTIVDIHTRHSTYRCVVLDGPRRIVLVQGGTRFDSQAVARIDGSTAGGSLMKVAWIGLGLHLEMSAGPHRTVTSAVQSIEIHFPSDSELPHADAVA
jgi:hypothetical protein